MVGVNAAISEMPQFQDVYMQLKRQGMGRTKAFRLAADKVSADPTVRSAVEKRAADWAGQYHHSTDVENVIRHIVPFYSWDRHALRFAKEQVLGRPLATNVITHIGQQGDTYLKKSLGDVPDFMKGAIPLPDKMGGVLSAILGGPESGRKKILLTGGWNPLTAAAEDANALLALGGAQHGSAGEALGGQLNPFLSGAISAVTGTKLMSGSKVHHHGGLFGTALMESLSGLPAASAVEGGANLLGVPFVPKAIAPNTTKSGNETLYHHSAAQTVRQILGIPVRDVSLSAAARMSGTKKKKKHGFVN
jgi:hypothetical protein